MRLAETTDVSPKQARDLMREHGKDSEIVEPKIAEVDEKPRIVGVDVDPVCSESKG